MKIEDILEDFTCPFKPTSRPGTLKRKAATYLGKMIDESLNKKDLKKLTSKTKKMKKSSLKTERFLNHQLIKELNNLG